MRLILFITFTLISSFIYAQKDCKFEINVVNDSLILKETSKVLLHEKSFGKQTKMMFGSLINDNGYLFLSIQTVIKSPSFIETDCLNKDSKVYIQLNNGKIYTLKHLEREICSNRIYDQEKKYNIRILTSDFYFLEDDYEPIKTIPISLIRIQYSPTDYTTYVIDKELKSEVNQQTYFPDQFLIEQFKCIE